MRSVAKTVPCVTQTAPALSVNRLSPSEATTNASAVAKLWMVHAPRVLRLPSFPRLHASLAKTRNVQSATSRESAWSALPSSNWKKMVSALAVVSELTLRRTSAATAVSTATPARTPSPAPSAVTPSSTRVASAGAPNSSLRPRKGLTPSLSRLTRPASASKTSVRRASRRWVTDVSAASPSSS